MNSIIFLNNSFHFSISDVKSAIEVKKHHSNSKSNMCYVISDLISDKKIERKKL